MSSEAIFAPPPGPPPSQVYPMYDPPPGPPPTHAYPLALLPTSFPLISPFQAHILATQGFTTFPISQRPALLDAAKSLFTASRAFFAQPPDHKTQFQVRTANPQGSEEGWSRVPGEKELYTVRRSGNDVCPPSIEPEARTLWHECGVLMQEMIRGVEQSLGMSPGALDNVVVPECTMPESGSDRHETLLRMFRYERRSPEADACPADGERNGKGRLVSEPHRDLGLFSLVIGASPGLEVWDASVCAWIPIEQPPHAEYGITATVLVGEMLSRLTNIRYSPGRHRVFVPSIPSHLLTKANDDSEYRYSIVFALRPHIPAIISTAALTTPFTGVFAFPIEGVRAREVFRAIARSHWNVNTSLEQREKQREKQRMQLQGGKKNKNELGEAETKEGVQDATDTSNSERTEGTKKKRWSLFQHALRQS